ncbi:thiamine diphosphate-binding protein [Thozetella sp. PMI_491]|nr:thiamine diphosphate-binding protein [Thozetella sp. PMI_491]
MTLCRPFPRSLRSIDGLAAQFRRAYATQVSTASTRRLNVPIDFGATALLHHHRSSLATAPEIPSDGPSSRLNLCQSVNSALRTALSSSEKVLCFGEDVAFGGVFRCTLGLQEEFGKERVFNTPLTEQGIVGVAIGAAAEGMKPVVEIQFADYVFPAFDQIVNEACKFRYREGTSGGNAGGLVIRTPCGGVGHGALYHTQSPEALFCHVPGVRVVMPRSPSQAKGLLLSAIMDCQDPVIFMEPKILYRAAVEEVPDQAFTLPLGKAEIVKPGNDLTIVSYGRPLYTCLAAIEAAEKDLSGLRVELIDLRTIYPWDRQTILDSVKRTGRAIVVHESMVNFGVGAEIAATIQEHSFFSMKAPTKRIAGWTTHTGLAYEKYILPDVTRIYDGILKSMEY